MQGGLVFFVALRAPFFPRVARPFLRKDSCTRDNPVYPADKLAALRTLLFTRLLRGRFWAKKSAREKQNLPVKILIFLGVKKFFWAWRKSKICPWKTITHVKKVKKTEKHARENLILPVKKTKNRKKRLSRPLFFSRPKKTLVLIVSYKFARAYIKWKVCQLNAYWICYAFPSGG